MRGTEAAAPARIGRMAGIFAPTVTGLLYFSGGLSPTLTVFALAHFIDALSVALLGIEKRSKFWNRVLDSEKKIWAGLT